MNSRLANKLKAVFIILISIAVQLQVVAQEFPEKPNPPRLVNDFAGLLDEGEIESLEKKLVAFNDTTSTQIAIVIINTLDGYPVSDYAFELGAKWGIGQKDKNNGLLFLIVKDDHKTFIAPGYGLEAVVPDITARKILKDIVKPNFKNGDYYQGINEATDVLIGLTSGEFKSDDYNKKKDEGMPLWLVIVIVVGVFWLIFYIKYKEVKNAHIGSKTLDFWTILMLMNASSGGGSSGGSSWGGGSDSDSGGFSGFGGGDFGGGGAGGDW